MNDLAISFLLRLGTASIFLAVTAVLALVMLNVLRCSSPLIHRLTWCMVLLQGILVFQLPIQIPWNETPVFNAVIGNSEIAAIKVPLSTLAADSNAPLIIASANSASTGVSQSDWASLLLLVWVGGIVFILGRWIRDYAVFIRAIESHVCDREDWCNEWKAIAATSKARKIPVLHISANVGPMLCRLPDGYRIVVPYELWRGFTSVQRQSILRHELAHFERRDVLKTLIANVIALLHWFNPMAWLASRSFEDSIEWTCDDHVRALEPRNSTNYAKALLAIGEYSRHKSAWSTAVFGGRFADRIRRVLSDERPSIPRFRMAMILGLLAACVAMRIFQVELVAQNPEKPKAIAAANSEVSTVQKDLFMVPVTTEFQQWYLKGHRTKKDDSAAKSYSAYANINLMSLANGQSAELDASQLDLSALQKALKMMDLAKEKEKLYLHLDHGTLPKSKQLELIKADIIEVFEKAGFASIRRTEGYRATNDWYGLSGKGESNLDEPQLGSEQVIVFPIKTPLSHFLTSKSSTEAVDCLVEVLPTLALDAKAFLTDSDKAIIREAVGKMTIPSDGVVRLHINLKRPKTVEEIRELAQVKKDSDYHREPTEFLKSLGFKKVVISVDCGSSIFLSSYN
jgi:beta-lactamase regulating signal transducer with metallopeptidase domain